MRAVLHYTAGPRLQALLADLSGDDLTLEWSPEGDAEELTRRLCEADALLHVLEPVTAEVMDASPRLRLVQKLGVGVNTIDLDAARARGIIVTNLPGVNARAVAEMALGLMLAVLRRIPAFDRDVRAGRGWPLDPAVPERLGDIGGRTVGLLGFGATASCLAGMLDAIGARVVHHRRDRSAPGWMALDDLLAASDVVSIHLPLTAETKGLVDAARIARMKPGAVLVNTGRGGIVDEAALADALASGRLAGAGLDVFALEPVDVASPLLALDNVVVTPHVAWLTADTLARAVELGAANCRRLLRGEPVAYRVV
jgi:phosphoglycerate dehydrogenase-like enzyme